MEDTSGLSGTMDNGGAPPLLLTSFPLNVTVEFPSNFISDKYSEFTAPPCVALLPINYSDDSL